MAVKNEKVYRTFIQGLVTEASPLTFPENASIDEENFVLNRDGSRSRRLGLDYENGFAKVASGFSAVDLQASKQSFHKWESPGGDTTVAIGIIRIKNKFWFANLLAASPSAALLNGGSPITLGGLSNADIEIDIINNKAVIVSSDLSNPVVLIYTPSSQAVSTAGITIEIRDIYGVNDGLAIDDRPETLSNSHKYNLRNQGWSEKIVTDSTAFPDALEYTKDVLDVYPSNADDATLGKNSNSAEEDFDKYNPNNLEKNSVSLFETAKGSSIINAFNRGGSRSALYDIPVPTDQETGNISTVAAYAQRLFYSGVASSISGGDSKSPNYSGFIFFSKIIRNQDDFGKCYQDLDPTNPDLNDLVSSDGGTIQIPDINKVVKIVASQSSVLVFAENGVWEVYGDTGGFIATSFQVSKISTNGVSNPNSIVDVNGSFIYWSKAGIYMLAPESATARYAAKSVSLKTIQTLFLNIPDIGRNNCKGYFDEKENRVRWLFNDLSTYSTNNYISKYNKELILDLTLSAFYLNKFSDIPDVTIPNSPFVADYIDIPGYVISTAASDVVAGTDTVTHTSSGTVIVTEDIEANRVTQFGYLTMMGSSWTITKAQSTTFKDWVTESTSGVNYSSFLITGYELFDDVMRKKQATYLYVYLTKTEDGFTAAGSGTGAHFTLNNQSSCRIQAQWNWANSGTGGKWGNEFEAYKLLRNYTPTGATDKFDTGDSVVVTKNKLRGTGKALSLKIQSSEGKDMKLLGWAIPVTGQSVG